MAKNTYRVGKTQWSKWNDAGREAYNHIRNQGMTEATAIAEANAVTAKTETERKNKKRGLLTKIKDAVEDVQDVAKDVQGVVETAADVAAAVSPVAAVAKTLVKATKGKKNK